MRLTIRQKLAMPIYDKEKRIKALASIHLIDGNIVYCSSDIKICVLQQTGIARYFSAKDAESILQACRQRHLFFPDPALDLRSRRHKIHLPLLLAQVICIAVVSHEHWWHEAVPVHPF